MFCIVRNYAQQDSVALDSDNMQLDGVYLTYTDFRYQQGIKKEQIVTTIDKEHLDFFNKVLEQKNFTYTYNDNKSTIDSKNVWGFIQNNTFYVNFKGDFYRVPVFGSISYFVATITVINSGFYDPRFGNTMGSTTSKELREFLIDFNDGVIMDFNRDKAEQLLGRDKALFEEYDKLSHKKKKDMIYGYIRKYNGFHPIYFLK